MKIIVLDIHGMVIKIMPIIDLSSIPRMKSLKDLKESSCPGHRFHEWNIIDRKKQLCKCDNCPEITTIDKSVKYYAWVVKMSKQLTLDNFRQEKKK